MTRAPWGADGAGFRGMHNPDRITQRDRMIAAQFLQRLAGFVRDEATDRDDAATKAARRIAIGTLEDADASLRLDHDSCFLVMLAESIAAVEETRLERIAARPVRPLDRRAVIRHLADAVSMAARNMGQAAVSLDEVGAIQSAVDCYGLEELTVSEPVKSLAERACAAVDGSLDPED